MRRVSIKCARRVGLVTVLNLMLAFCPTTSAFGNSNTLLINSRTAGQWQEIATADGEFSILIPGQPKLFLEPRLDFDGGIRLSNQRVYVVCGMGIAFIVELYDASSPVRDLKGLLENRRYIQTFERPISLNGFNGRQYRGNWKDIYTSIQYFTGKRRIYVVQVISRDDKHPAITQFLSSLRLGTRVGDVRDRPPDDASLLPIVNLDSHVYMPDHVTRKAIAIWKPEPQYSADGLKANVEGNVRLRVVVSFTGQVGEVTVLKGLGHGLNEKAIEVAKATLFIPAEKDGHVVSQYITLEYNFRTGLY